MTQPGTKCWRLTHGPVQEVFADKSHAEEAQKIFLENKIPTLMEEGRFLTKQDLVNLSIEVAAEIYKAQQQMPENPELLDIKNIKS